VADDDKIEPFPPALANALLRSILERHSGMFVFRPTPLENREMLGAELLRWLRCQKAIF
jgi:hypothetical protein